MKRELTIQQRRALGIVFGLGAILIGALMLLGFGYLILSPPVPFGAETILYPAMPLASQQASMVAGMYIGVVLIAILILLLSQWFPSKDDEEKRPFNLRQEIGGILLNVPVTIFALYMAVRIGLWQMPLDVPVGINPAEVAGIVKCAVVLQATVFIFAARDMMFDSVQEYREKRREQKAKEAQAIQAG